MITIGALGQEWRAAVTPWGGIRPWDGAHGALDWYVAAEDRWHIPADEAAVRQRRLDATAVVETRLKVPDGDVVQRIGSIPDRGGMTLVEFENASTHPVAIALDRRDVYTERPIADVPIEGIELPSTAFVMPLAHRSTVQVAIAHSGPVSGRVPSGLPPIGQIARGWRTIVDRASRLVLPDGDPGATSAERVAAMRCELALGAMPHGDDDPTGFLLALGELVRMGERPDPWLPELVDAVEAVARDGDGGWVATQALGAADRVLLAADERRARSDLAAMTRDRPSLPRPAVSPGGIAEIAWLDSLLADRSVLLPAGIPELWLGQSFEAYGIATGPSSNVSFAVRWHGERPAVLWEQTGEPVRLVAPSVAPDWSTDAAKGESLWPAPVR